MSAEYLKELIDELDSLSGIGAPFLGKHYPENGTSGPLMDDGQDQKIDRKTPQHPVGTVQGQGELIVWQEWDYDLSHDLGVDGDFFEKSLNSPVMRLDFGRSRKRGGQLGKIHGLHFKQGDDEASETFDPGQVPAQMKFEHVG